MKAENTSDNGQALQMCGGSDFKVSQTMLPASPVNFAVERIIDVPTVLRAHK